MKINLATAILSINKKSEFFYNSEDINTLEWYDGNPTNITKEQILAKQSELQALEDVYENRRKEYGAIVDQLDEIYHNGIDAWKTRIASIKAKYPKGN